MEHEYQIRQGKTGEQDAADREGRLGTEPTGQGTGVFQVFLAGQLGSPFSASVSSVPCRVRTSHSWPITTSRLLFRVFWTQAGASTVGWLHHHMGFSQHAFPEKRTGPTFSHAPPWHMNHNAVTAQGLRKMASLCWCSWLQGLGGGGRLAEGTNVRHVALKRG